MMEKIIYAKNNEDVYQIKLTVISSVGRSGTSQNIVYGSYLGPANGKIRPSLGSQMADRMTPEEALNYYNLPSSLIEIELNEYLNISGLKENDDNLLKKYFDIIKGG